MQSFQRVLFIASFDLRALECAAQKLDGLVVEFAVDGIGMTVFAAVCKAEFRRVFPTCRGAVGDFTDQSQSAQSFGADAGHAQQLFEVFGLALVGFQQNFFDGLRMNVADGNLMVRRQR